jgi:hypothetical protein
MHVHTGEVCEQLDDLKDILSLIKALIEIWAL